MTAPLAYITGASSGIGQALAARFHRAGYRLALVARRSAEVQAWAQSQGMAAADVAVYAADVRDIASIVSAGRACVAAQGVPDVVIANAGISVGMDTAVFDDLEVMRAVYETNNLGMAATFIPLSRPWPNAGRARWWALPALRASAACLGTARIAPAKRRWPAIARACAVNCARAVSRW